jgi:hypothetical protein
MSVRKSIGPTKHLRYVDFAHYLCNENQEAKRSASRTHTVPDRRQFIASVVVRGRRNHVSAGSAFRANMFLENMKKTKNPQRINIVPMIYTQPTLVPCARPKAGGAFGYHLDGRGNMMTMHE